MSHPAVKLLTRRSFQPTNISGLQLWLDAASITGLADGAAVATWADLSGNSRDVSQGTSGNRPTYQTAELNNRPVVRFDGTNDYLHIASNLGLGQVATIITAVKINGTSESGIAVKIGESATSAAADDGYALGLGSGNADVNGNEILGLYEQVRWLDPDTNYGTGGVIVTMRPNGTVCTFFKNGTQAGGTFSGTTCRTPGAFTYIGCGSHPTPGSLARFWPYDIAEVCVYSSVLSTNDRLLVERYLGSKWGVTVA